MSHSTHIQTFNHLCDQPTLPTSTRLVTMTIEDVFSCQTILQKSLTVSCMGPRHTHSLDVFPHWSVDSMYSTQCTEIHISYTHTAKINPTSSLGSIR